MHSVTGGFFFRFVAFWSSVHDRTHSQLYSGEFDLKYLNVIIIIYFSAVISVTDCVTYGLLQTLKRGTDSRSPKIGRVPFNDVTYSRT